MPTMNEIMTAPLTQLQNMFSSMNTFNNSFMSQIQNMMQNAPTPFGNMPTLPELPPMPNFGQSIQPLPVQPINGVSSYRSTGVIRSTSPTTVKKVQLEVL